MNEFFCFWIVSTLLQKYPSSFEKVSSWTILQFCWMKICFWLLHLMSACNCCINEQNWRLIKKIRPKRGSLNANTFREQHKVLKSWKPQIGEIFEHWQDVLTKKDPSDLYLHVWLNDADPSIRMIAWLTRNMLEMSAKGLQIDCGAFIACGQINLSRQSIWINKLATEKATFIAGKKQTN